MQKFWLKSLPGAKSFPLSFVGWFSWVMTRSSQSCIFSFSFSSFVTWFAFFGPSIPSWFSTWSGVLQIPLQQELGGLRNTAEVPLLSRLQWPRAPQPGCLICLPVCPKAVNNSLIKPCAGSPSKLERHTAYSYAFFCLMCGLNEVERKIKHGMEIGDVVLQGRQAGATSK